VNPLLEEAELPAFDALRPEHVGPALDRLLADAEAALDAAADPALPADYTALERVLDLPTERLHRLWGYVGHLRGVIDSPAWRQAYGDNLPRVTDFMTRLGADARLLDKMRALAASPAYGSLSPARRKVVDDALRDFALGGACLQGEARARHAEIQARLAELSQRYADNLMDAADAWSIVVPPERLAGVPAPVVQAARSAAQADGMDGCKLTLQAPCRVPVLACADDRSLRETVFRAYATLGSELGDPAWDNATLMAEMLSLRQEEAALLGYASFADLSLVPKMASSPAEVQAFVRDLAARTRPFAEAEVRELQAYATGVMGLDRLEAWDRSYFTEKLKQERHGFDDEALRPYFPLAHVVSGLFELFGDLFDLVLSPMPAPTWHPDVRTFRVVRGGDELGTLYLDLYARPGKQSGAWLDDLRSRWRRPDGSLQRPLAALVCNFPAPSNDRPSCLSHDELLTLCHELGHALHQLLTQVDERPVAGINGVEWDAVEMPSQFMENFAWEWPVLQRLSAHVDSGEPLPRALFERLRAARNFHAGLGLLRQCELALFDMRLHAESGAGDRIMALAREVNAELHVLPRDPADRWPHGFSHIFDGGYAAGYYGYSWAEVLSADAFSAFEEQGLLDAETGRRWRQCVLEAGGSRPALESFTAFRGRAPRIDALLRHQGLSGPVPA